MFTGLVETTGTLRRLSGRPVARAVFETTLAPLSLGESISCDGVCLTVDRIVSGGFEADVSSETLARTTFGTMTPPCRIHFERSLAVGDRLGGHLVLGHVDGVGEVVELGRVGDAARFAVRAPRDLGRYLAPKGSVSVSGVSLTINGIADEPTGCVFDVMLVPHTLAKTKLGELGPGSHVNLEVDVLARYVARQLAIEPVGRGEGGESPDERLVGKLRDGGFL